jgi:hypothetical protein
MVLHVLVDLALMLLVPARAFVVNANPLSFALNAAHAPSAHSASLAIFKSMI